MGTSSLQGWMSGKFGTVPPTSYQHQIADQQIYHPGMDEAPVLFEPINRPLTAGEKYDIAWDEGQWLYADFGKTRFIEQNRAAAEWLANQRSSVQYVEDGNGIRFNTPEGQPLVFQPEEWREAYSLAKKMYPDKVLTDQEQSRYIQDEVDKFRRYEVEEAFDGSFLDAIPAYAGGMVGSMSSLIGVLSMGVYPMFLAGRGAMALGQAGARQFGGRTMAGMFPSEYAKLTAKNKLADFTLRHAFAGGMTTAVMTPAFKMSHSSLGQDFGAKEFMFIVAAGAVLDPIFSGAIVGAGKGVRRIRGQAEPPPLTVEEVPVRMREYAKEAMRRRDIELGNAYMMYANAIEESNKNLPPKVPENAPPEVVLAISVNRVASLAQLLRDARTKGVVDPFRASGGNVPHPILVGANYLIMSENRSARALQHPDNHQRTEGVDPRTKIDEFEEDYYQTQDNSDMSKEVTWDIQLAHEEGRSADTVTGGDPTARMNEFANVEGIEIEAKQAYVWENGDRKIVIAGFYSPGRPYISLTVGQNFLDEDIAIAHVIGKLVAAKELKLTRELAIAYRIGRRKAQKNKLNTIDFFDEVMTTARLDAFMTSKRKAMPTGEDRIIWGKEQLYTRLTTEVPSHKVSAVEGMFPTEELKLDIYPKDTRARLKQIAVNAKAYDGFLNPGAVYAQDLVPGSMLGDGQLVSTALDNLPELPMPLLLHWFKGKDAKSLEAAKNVFFNEYLIQMKRHGITIPGYRPNFEMIDGYVVGKDTLLEGEGRRINRFPVDWGALAEVYIRVRENNALGLGKRDWKAIQDGIEAGFQEKLGTKDLIFEWGDKALFIKQVEEQIVQNPAVWGDVGPLIREVAELFPVTPAVLKTYTSRFPTAGGSARDGNAMSIHISPDQGYDVATTFFHEMAHSVFDSLPPKMYKQFLNMWLNKDLVTEALRPIVAHYGKDGKDIAIYAQSRPTEFFAHAMEAYALQYLPSMAYMRSPDVIQGSNTPVMYERGRLFRLPFEMKVFFDQIIDKNHAMKVANTEDMVLTMKTPDSLFRERLKAIITEKRMVQVDRWGEKKMFANWTREHPDMIALQKQHEEIKAEIKQIIGDGKKKPAEVEVYQGIMNMQQRFKALLAREEEFRQLKRMRYEIEHDVIRQQELVTDVMSRSTVDREALLKALAYQEQRFRSLESMTAGEFKGTFGKFVTDRFGKLHRDAIDNLMRTKEKTLGHTKDHIGYKKLEVEQAQAVLGDTLRALDDIKLEMSRLMGMSTSNFDLWYKGYRRAMDKLSRTKRPEYLDVKNKLLAIREKIKERDEELTAELDQIWKDYHNPRMDLEMIKDAERRDSHIATNDLKSLTPDEVKKIRKEAESEFHTGNKYYEDGEWIPAMSSYMYYAHDKGGNLLALGSEPMSTLTQAAGVRMRARLAKYAGSEERPVITPGEELQISAQAKEGIRKINNYTDRYRKLKFRPFKLRGREVNDVTAIGRKMEDSQAAQDREMYIENAEYFDALFLRELGLTDPASAALKLNKSLGARLHSIAQDADNPKVKEFLKEMDLREHTLNLFQKAETEEQLAAMPELGKAEQDGKDLNKYIADTLWIGEFGENGEVKFWRKKRDGETNEHYEKDITEKNRNWLANQYVPEEKRKELLQGHIKRNDNIDPYTGEYKVLSEHPPQGMPRISDPYPIDHYPSWIGKKFGILRDAVGWHWYFFEQKNGRNPSNAEIQQAAERLMGHYGHTYVRELELGMPEHVYKEIAESQKWQEIWEARVRKREGEAAKKDADRQVRSDERYKEEIDGWVKKVSNWKKFKGKTIWEKEQKAALEVLLESRLQIKGNRFDSKRVFAITKQQERDIIVKIRKETGTEGTNNEAFHKRYMEEMKRLYDVPYHNDPTFKGWSKLSWAEKKREINEAMRDRTRSQEMQGRMNEDEMESLRLEVEAGRITKAQMDEVIADRQTLEPDEAYKDWDPFIDYNYHYSRGRKMEGGGYEWESDDRSSYLMINGKRLGSHEMNTMFPEVVRQQMTVMQKKVQSMSDEIDQRFTKEERDILREAGFEGIERAKLSQVQELKARLIIETKKNPMMPLEERYGRHMTPWRAFLHDQIHEEIGRISPVKFKMYTDEQWALRRYEIQKGLTGLVDMDELHAKMVARGTWQQMNLEQHITNRDHHDIFFTNLEKEFQDRVEMFQTQVNNIPLMNRILEFGTPAPEYLALLSMLETSHVKNPGGLNVEQAERAEWSIMLGNMSSYMHLMRLKGGLMIERPRMREGKTWNDVVSKRPQDAIQGDHIQREIIRRIYDGPSPSNKDKPYYREGVEVREAIDKMALNLKRLGLDFDMRPDYMTYQSWDRNRVLRVTQAEFINDLIKWVDIEKYGRPWEDIEPPNYPEFQGMEIRDKKELQEAIEIDPEYFTPEVKVSFQRQILRVRKHERRVRGMRKKYGEDWTTKRTEEQARNSLGTVYDQITQEDMSLQLLENLDVGLATPLGDMYKSMRYVTFKDAESWLAFHDKYGKGSVHEALMFSAKSRTIHAALLRVLGPDPAKSFKELLRIAYKQAEQKGRKFKWLNTRALIASYRIVTGVTEDVDSQLMDAILRPVRQLGVAVGMGAAPLTAIPSDSIIAGVTAKKYYGTDLIDMARIDMNLLMGQSREGQIYAGKEALLGMDWMLAAMGSNTRMADMTAGGFTGKFAELTNRASILHNWTRSGKQMVKMVVSKKFAENLDKSFHELPDYLQELLRGYTERAGRTQNMTPEGMWSAMRWAGKISYGNVPQIRTRALAEGNNKWNSYQVAWLSLQDEAAEWSILSPTVSTKRVFTGNSRRGTLDGELRRSIFQFLHFPMKFFQYVKKGVWSEKNTYGKFTFLLKLFAMMTIGGVFSEQVRLLINGYDLADWTDPELVKAGIRRGGGLSFAGEFFTHTKYDGKDHGHLVDLTGPTGRFIEDTLGTGSKVYDDGLASFPQHSFNFAREWLSIADWWYLRPLWNTIMADALADMSGTRPPGRLSEYNTPRHHDVGDLLPRRMPDLSGRASRTR